MFAARSCIPISIARMCSVVRVCLALFTRFHLPFFPASLLLPFASAFFLATLFCVCVVIAYRDWEKKFSSPCQRISHYISWGKQLALQKKVLPYKVTICMIHPRICRRMWGAVLCVISFDMRSCLYPLASVSALSHSCRSRLALFRLLQPCMVSSKTHTSRK